ncbi:hypothetical protein EV426DRAFT_713323 [Tirmania nivea]|nr:hypothetical protein EV426DRAFT_713323 [Tirmania nivea]
MAPPNLNPFTWFWKTAAPPPLPPPSPPSPPPPFLSYPTSPNNHHPSSSVLGPTLYSHGTMDKPQEFKYWFTVRGWGQYRWSLVTLTPYPGEKGLCIEDVKEKIIAQENLSIPKSQIMLYHFNGDFERACEYEPQDTDVLKPEIELSASWPFSSGSKKDIIVAFCLEPQGQSSVGTSTRHQNPQMFRHHKIITVNGPLHSGDQALKLQPSKRKPFQETAELLQAKRPVILHGPYHSGKTTFLWAMEEYLRASDMYPVYISMTEGDFHCRDHIESLYALFSFRIFGQYLDGKDLRSQISKAYNQRTGHGEKTKRKCLCLLIDEMQMIYLQCVGESVHAPPPA